MRAPATRALTTRSRRGASTRTTNARRRALALAACTMLGAGCQSLIGLEDRSLRDAGAGGTGGAHAHTPADAGKSTASKACQSYCDAVLSACTDKASHTQYYQQSRPVCLNVCTLLEEAGKAPPDAGISSRDAAVGGDAGAIELSGNNTLACRAKQALNAAQIEPEVQCPFAGPGGADTCGNNCESYCYLMSRACAAYPQYLTDDCVHKCGALRDLGDEQLPAGASSLDATRDHEGDTVQCRLVHVSNATVDPTTHCWHAQLAPRAKDMMLSPCAGYPTETAPRCEDYCRILETACPSDLAVYESHDQCMAVCAAFDPGTLMDDGTKPVLEDNNNLGCRKAHSYNALLATPEVHCPHSGPGGAGVCGSNCASFCKLLEHGCSVQFEVLYGKGAAASASCESDCDALGGNGYKGYSVAKATGADSNVPFACRLLAVSRALAEPTDPTQCEAAMGGGACAK